MATGKVEKVLQVRSEAHGGEVVVVNESDFDASVHELVDGGEVPVVESPEPTLVSVFGEDGAASLVSRGYDTLNDLANAELNDLTRTGMEFDAAQGLMSAAREALAG